MHFFADKKKGYLRHLLEAGFLGRLHREEAQPKLFAGEAQQLRVQQAARGREVVGGVPRGLGSAKLANFAKVCKIFANF